MVYGSCAVAGDSPAAVKLVEVTRIWDQAPHNAFTDLVRFHDQWLCSFREGTGHAAGAGSIRVLISKDGKSWESAAVLSEPHVDLRDPKLSVTPDGRLMMVGGAAVPATRDPVTDHYSFVAFSKDGKEWSKPQRVLDSWQWLWRVTWHKGKAYGVAYQWDPKAARTERTYKAALFQSSDGVKFEQLASFDIPNATEATLAFAGDTLYCLQRRDGQPNSAMLGTSLPPYRDWTWKDLGHYFGGPNFIHLPDGSWWAAGRMIDAGKPQTVLCRLDVKKGELQPVLKLPSGGDTSYPGLVWHNGQLWISYYSSHEKKDGKDHSAIYLARVQVSAP
jgi:hypothetical protein